MVCYCHALASLARRSDVVRSGWLIMAILYHDYYFVLVGKQEIAAAIERVGHHNQEPAQLYHPRLPALQLGIDRFYKLRQRTFHH